MIHLIERDINKQNSILDPRHDVSAQKRTQKCLICCLVLLLST